MTTRLANPIAQWREAPVAGVAVALSRMYWAYDAGTSTWYLTDDRRLEAGRLVDLTGAGSFTIEFLAAIPPGTRTLAHTSRPDGDILAYEPP